MSSSTKPIKVYGATGPNPPKVIMILEELQVPYEIIATPISEAKGPEYTAINPNGRLPAIEDPNTDLTLWESGAIIEYLIETYDNAHKLSFPAGSNEAYLAKQWLHFQVSGQGPYYGQAVWFTKYHAEKLPSAVERYVKEINRVTGVLEGWLAKQEQEHAGADDGPWLVGGKFSYADIAFVMWQTIMGILYGKEDYDVDNYPQVKAWLERMTARETIKKPLDNVLKQFRS